MTVPTRAQGDRLTVAKHYGSPGIPTVLDRGGMQSGLRAAFWCGGVQSGLRSQYGFGRFLVAVDSRRFKVILARLLSSEVAKAPKGGSAAILSALPGQGRGLVAVPDVPHSRTVPPDTESRSGRSAE